MRSLRHKELNDEEILVLISENDRTAFDELFHRYWEVLVQTSFNITLNKEVAHDCVQDVFLSIWRRRHKLAIEDVERYLFRAAKLKVLEYLRKENISKSHLSRIKLIEYTNNTDERVRMNDLESELRKSMAKLPEQCKKVFELSRNQHLSNKEISQALNISIKTVEGHITKALKRLAEDLQRFFILIFMIIFF